MRNDIHRAGGIEHMNICKSVRHFDVIEAVPLKITVRGNTSSQSRGYSFDARP